MKSFEELKKQFGVEEIEDEEIKSSMEFTRLESVMEQKIMEEATNKERMYGVWDRETNNY